MLRNFDNRKTASAINKILLVIALLSAFSVSFVSAGFRLFAFNHPGLIGVLVAVSGEVYFDWREESGRHAKWKKFFMALLVVSLAYELYEASESDKKAADAILEAKQAGIVAADAVKEASEANERAAKFDADRESIAKQAEEIRGTNLILQTELLELQARTTPRTITDLDREKFIKLLANQPKGKVEVEISFGSGNEISDYAEKIREMIGEAGYDVGKTLAMTTGTFPKGIFVGVRDITNQPPFSGAIQNGLNKIGIPADGFDARGQKHLNEDTLLIIVGGKP